MPEAKACSFNTTHWSVVLQGGTTHRKRRKPSNISAAPISIRYTRTSGGRGHGAEDAHDLTQSFFARLLEKNYVQQADQQRGKFRTFLLSALGHFLADEWDRARRQKRGGARTLISFDATSADERYRLEPADPLDATKLFERRWATTLLERAVDRLEHQFSERGQAKLFNGLRAFLVGDQGDATYVQAAPELGLTPAAMKMAVSRMRARCRELLREEIAQTVTGPQEAEEEYRALVAALRS